MSITPLEIGILIFLSIAVGFCMKCIRDDIQSHIDDEEETE